jgi:hypothetical protein
LEEGLCDALGVRYPLEPVLPILHQLLAAGADPALPESRPFLLHSFNMTAPTVDWLLEEHQAGRRLLPPATAALALHWTIVRCHPAALAPLLDIVRQHREELSPKALLQAARLGGVQAVTDLLELRPGLASSDASTKACLLACAHQNRDEAQRKANVAVLLAAGARLHLHDLSMVVQRADAPALRRLLRLGTPQVSLA